MKRIAAIMGGALRTWFRSKHTLFWTLVFPLLLMLLFGAIFSVSEDPQFDFYVQNQDLIDGEPSPFSATFVAMLNGLNPESFWSRRNAANLIANAPGSPFPSLGYCTGPLWAAFPPHIGQPSSLASPV